MLTVDIVLEVSPATVNAFAKIRFVRAALCECNGIGRVDIAPIARSCCNFPSDTDVSGYALLLPRSLQNLRHDVSCFLEFRLRKARWSWLDGYARTRNWPVNNVIEISLAMS